MRMTGWLCHPGRRCCRGHSTYIFNHVCLRTNMRKTVSMDCQPCYIPDEFLELAYMQ